MVVIIFSISCFVLLLFYSLTGTNQLNSKNSGAAVLVSAYYSPILISTTLYVFRLVRLGHRIIPLSKKILLEDAKISKLAEFEYLQGLCFVLGFVAVIVQAIVGEFQINHQFVLIK